jgi:hypothetical protein
VDNYSFIVEMTKAISSMIAAFAWPASIILIAFVFRKKLIELLPLLTVKHKDFQISFGLDKAEEEARKILPPPIQTEVAPSIQEKVRLEQLARLAPRAAIMEARANVEEAVNEFAEAVSISAEKPYSKLIKELNEGQLIDQNTVRLLNEVRQIGSAAAHNMTEPTEEEAVRYQALAEQLIRHFKIATGAARMPPPEPIPPGLP